MTIRQTLQESAMILHSPERIQETRLLLAFVWKKESAWILSHPEAVLPPSVLRRFRMLLQRRARHEPIAYLLGVKEFYGRAFRVTPAVLIPRPETECIVELIITRVTQGLLPRPQILLDVGTGSGVLAITLQQEIHPQTVLASDTYPNALRIASENARRLRSQVTFLRGDLLSPTIQRHLTSSLVAANTLLITANLPYLPNTDRTMIAPDITRHEPHSALFAGVHGTDFLERFLHQIHTYLLRHPVKHMECFLELDPRNAKRLSTFTRRLFSSALITLHRDLAGRNRILHLIVDSDG